MYCLKFADEPIRIAQKDFLLARLFLAFPLLQLEEAAFWSGLSTCYPLVCLTPTCIHNITYNQIPLKSLLTWSVGMVGFLGPGLTQSGTGAVPC
jgi:hypothetical protein